MRPNGLPLRRVFSKMSASSSARASMLFAGGRSTTAGSERKSFLMSCSWDSAWFWRIDP